MAEETNTSTSTSKKSNKVEKLDAAQMRDLVSGVLEARGDEELNKLIDSKEKDYAEIARRMRKAERAALPTFARLDHRFSENAVYDAAKATRSVGLSIMLGMGIYKAGKWAVEWYRGI